MGNVGGVHVADSSVDLRGRTAIVTGAASGIGRAIAGMLASHGAAVGVCDLHEVGARTVAQEIEAAGGHAIPVRADVSRPDDVEAMVAATAREFGGLDILVNNAGLQFISPVHEFPVDKWNLLMGVMLTGTFLCTRYALPSMITRRWGRVINISSIHGLVASPFKSAYIAAKHGIIGLTRTVALEVGEYNITANAICPSYVRTPLVMGQIAEQSKAHGIPEAEVVQKIMLAPAAVKRLLEPDEIAAFALYLCSEHAAGMTGGVYPIDVGWTAR
ncbi:MAG: 3-hydroxybutyrate dehydrogenase [Bacillati bacterium ANGP1]|uniref:3-hydroxybutyrate dehydrogenase n=1 Tax=Candidatus Segetimicrobium genomatis TaxID=2569760 RepID=A0A537LJV9_9BACT|nr:MAG: 3-hydroxybutyrate dehydrogenase [Terrabacteria group bacterium ANGP1]